MISRATKKRLGHGLIAVVAVAGLGVLAERRAVGREGGAQAVEERFAIESGLLNAVMAKELCSCHFVDGLSYEQCRDTANLPSGAPAATDIDIDELNRTVSSRFRLYVGPARGYSLGPSAKAKFVSMQFGCVLQEGPGLPGGR